jgi:PAS domain S-box-containing protein
MAGSNGTNHVLLPPDVDTFEPASEIRKVVPGAQSERLRFQEWFDFASDGYLITDLQGIIEQANYAAARLLKTRREYLPGKPLGFLLAEQSRSDFYRRLTQLGTRGIEQWDARLGRPGETPRDVSLTAAVLAGDEARPIKLRWILHDLSAVRQTERALSAEKRLADGLAEMVDNLILIVDANGRIFRCNPFALALSGALPGELRGRDWCEALLPAEDRAEGRRLLNEVSQAGVARSGVLGFLSRQGGRRAITWSARQLGDAIVLAGHDVTELHEAQRQALQAERLAAIGQMSTVLAHEGRNALQRIQSCLFLLTYRLQDRPEVLEWLERAQKAQHELQRLFDDVRGYAVDSRPQPQTCDLRRLWREAWSELAGLPAVTPAELREDDGATTTLCRGDPIQLKQVFRNLLENALSTGAEPARVRIYWQEAALAGEPAVQVHVCDNGPGFPAETRDRVFDPFFTTKTQGTGLGLAVCKRIIEAHGGHIEVGANGAPGGEIILTLPRRVA